MLEAKELKKIYKTKKGVSVEALKGVSIKFPDKGMVFLLGKSGSGKSTLLNLLGGLDKYDDGEIVIKGVSSKEFRQSHFDSYRNTYVGFIFQEYNVLEDFTVGANIALAIELQGRKATDEEINRILKEVDLEGFGDRKPNELSGGQKQRVAIARALVKNPHIIMADEPTGALDSKTGKQVFDTLKKLSKEKLVIVVSHDREFAEYYGDRIIELADGNILSDVERKADAGAVDLGENSEGIIFGENELVITKNYHLTEEDRKMINNYLSGKASDIKAVIKDKKQVGFEKTDESSIVSSEGNFKLIKSKLPLKNAFKIGASSLKHKKIRLAITIILSFAAFSMFALADTFGNYDHIKTCTNSIEDTQVSYASVTKSKYIDQSGIGYWDDWSYKLSKEDVEKITKDTGVEYKGVYVPSEGQPLLENYDVNVKLTEREDGELYPTYFSGYMEITDSDLKEMEYDIVAGRLPKGDKSEVAISEYVFKTFEKAGYVDKTGKKSQIKSFKEMIGKQIKIGEVDYTVVGIVDTKVDFDRYKSIIENPTGKSSAEILTGFALAQELQRIKDYSMSGVAMLGEGAVDKIRETEGSAIEMSNFWMDFSNGNYTVIGNYIDKLSNCDASKITWIDGKKQALGEKEIIISQNALYNAKGNMEKSVTRDDAIKYLQSHPEFTMTSQKNANDKYTTEDGWKIVGIIESEEDVYILPDELYNKDWSDAGEYAFAVATMPKEKSEIRDLVEYCYTARDDVKYKMQNSVTFELDTVDEMLEILSKVFLYIGLGFAVFAAIMLSNFIATSISYKKQEIGILRAIGARSHDVFKIFFSESFIIAIINFVLSVITTVIITSIINGVMREEVGILITILSFGFRQVILLFAISVAVAAVASFIPVYRIASKKPIEAIRNR